jgi:hypothetical protein
MELWLGISSQGWCAVSSCAQYRSYPGVRQSRLSNETGARTYLLGKVGDGELLRQDCADISNELREQYTLGFVAPDPSRPSYRSLRVDLPGKPELSVRVRRG